MICILTTKQKTNQYNNLRSVVLPAVKGEMEILAGHSETFALLRPGKVILKKITNGQIEIKINKGLACVFRDKIVIIL
jgi:F0F1-type ATP synthase epsilon subunit